MIRTALSVVFCSFTSLTALVAQNEVQIWPERNGSAGTYADRARGGTNQVEVLTEMSSGLFRGVGDNGSTCTVNGFFAWMVDDDANTPEVIDAVFRRPLAGGVGPDPSPAGEIGRIGPIVVGPVPGGGRVSVRASVTFSPPLSVPCDTDWYFGTDLRAAPGWPGTDGLSMFVAWYYPLPSRMIGDNPRLGAPNVSWRVLGGVATSTPDLMTVWHGPTTSRPVLNVGGIDPLSINQTPAGSPCYGAGGLYPATDGGPRRDGIGLRIEDRNNPGAPVGLFAAFGFNPTPFPLASLGIQGRLHLDLATFLSLGTATLGGGGVAEVTIAPPGSLPTTLAGALVQFQAVVLGSAGVGFASNSAGTSF